MADGYSHRKANQLEDRPDLRDGTLILLPSPLPGILPDIPVDSSTIRERLDKLPTWMRHGLPIGMMERALCVYEAYSRARLEYVDRAIAEETGDLTVGSVLTGVLWGLLASLVVVGVTTIIGGALGAAVGALITALIGGEGAIPGAIAGGEIGFDAGIWILDRLGLGILLVYVGSKLYQAIVPLKDGITIAWNAGSSPAAARKQAVDLAARQIAKAMGVLVRLILEGIVAYLTAKGMAFIMERLAVLVGALKRSKLGEGFAKWVEENYQKLLKNPKLKEPAPEPAGGVGTGGGARSGSAASEPEPGPKPASPGGKSLDQLKDAGKAIDPADKSGQLTKAGRALQKHGSRPGSAFPKATGNPEAINAQGQAVLEGIMNDPGTTPKPNRFGGSDYTAPDGRGARYDGNGNFMGFLEP
jgi:hypothetical protein